MLSLLSFSYMGQWYETHKDLLRARQPFFESGHLLPRVNVSSESKSGFFLSIFPNTQRATRYKLCLTERITRRRDLLFGISRLDKRQLIEPVLQLARPPPHGTGPHPNGLWESALAGPPPEGGSADAQKRQHLLCSQNLKFHLVLSQRDSVGPRRWPTYH